MIAIYLTVLVSECVPLLTWCNIFFIGFVGLFDFALLFPLLLIWHFSGLEAFEFPPTPNVWTLLLVNGFVGTVLSELLWLW